MKKKVWVIILVILILSYGIYYCRYHDYFWGYTTGDETWEYINGEKNGLWTAYYKEYTIIPFLNLLHSKKISHQWNYVNWKEEWEWIDYYPDWEIEKVVNYKNWILDWEYMRYDRWIYEDDDKSVMKWNYVNWKEDGVWLKEYSQSKRGLSKIEYYHNNWVIYKTVFYYTDWRVEEVDRDN
jgi:antitoxin component YwqK of YwqJK toxin-antitoxin module